MNMTTTSTERQVPAHRLIDTVLARFQLKNDAALARMLEVGPPVISKIRRGLVPVTASIILKLHEQDPEKFPVRAIRELLEPV